MEGRQSPVLCGESLDSAVFRPSLWKTLNPKVTGSIPVRPTNKFTTLPNPSPYLLVGRTGDRGGRGEYSPRMNLKLGGVTASPKASAIGGGRRPHHWVAEPLISKPATRLDQRRGAATSQVHLLYGHEQ